MIRPLKMISLASSFNNKHTQSKMSKLQQIQRTANVPRVKIVLNRECQKVKMKRRLSDEKDEDDYEDEDETDSNSLIKHRTSKCVKLDTHFFEKQKSKFFDLEAYKYLDKEELNEKHLWQLTNAYDNLDEWKLLAVRLNLSKQDIDVIEFNYSRSFDGLRECFYQCLLKWRLQQPENCQFTFLCKILLTKFEKTNEFIENLAQAMFFKERNESREQEYKRILKNYLDALLSKHSEVKSLDLSLKLDEKHLWSASEFICLEWKSIARNLCLNESDLIDIHMRYARFEGIRECCYQMLLLWSQFYSHNANLEYLCLSLIEMRFNLFAKKLLEQCLC